MINKNKYVQSLTQAKNDLKSGKPWGEVWTKVKTEFADLPSEQIDYDLGLEWRQTGAYQQYISGKLIPVKPTEKYDYFSDLSLAKYKILQGDSISKVQKNLKNKYKSVDDVKLLTDLNSIKISKEPAGRLSVAGPMTPEIKKAQTVTPKEQKQIEAYQKTLDPDYLSGKKDATKDQVKIEAAAIEQAKRIPAQVVELPQTGKVEIIRPEAAEPTQTGKVEIIRPEAAEPTQTGKVEIIRPEAAEPTQTVEIVKPEPVTSVPKTLPPETPYTEKAKPFVQETEPKPVYLKSDPIRASLLQGAFGNDPDIIDLDRKYGDNIDKMALPENKDIYYEVASATKTKIDNIIKPILGATSPGYAFISEKLDAFYDKTKTDLIQYESNKAINNPAIENTTVPNPFFSEIVLPKYELTLKDLATNVDMSISGSTMAHIETKKQEADQTITLMSPIPGSTPVLVIFDQTVKDIIGRKIEKESKLGQWQIDLGKARRDKEQLLTAKLPGAIAEFSKLGLGDFGNRVPTMEEINKAIVDRQLKINNIPENSIIGQVRVAQKDMIVQESGIINEISGRLGDVFSSKGTESAKVLQEKFGTEYNELAKTLGSLSKLDATGKMRNELNDVYTKSVETENGLMKKYKDASIELEKLIASPGMNDYIAAGSKDLSAISQTEYVGLLNFQAQNKATIDKMNAIAKRIEDIKAEMARNSTTGNNAVAKYKAINEEIKTSFGGMMSAITSENFKKIVTSGNIMSAEEANSLIKSVKQYEKNRVFVEQNNDKYLKELDNYDMKTQQALLEEGVIQDKIQKIFENISKISNEVADADKRIKYYSGFDEIYELQRQSKLAEAVNLQSYNPFNYKSLKQATREVFGDNATSYDYKDVTLEKYKQVVPAAFGAVFDTVGKIISVPVNLIDGMVRLNAKEGTYVMTGLGLRGSFIASLEQINNNILAEAPLKEELMTGVANFYKYLYTESFPNYVNYARDAAKFMDESLDWEAGNVDVIREWFLGGLKAAGLPEMTRYFLESYSEVLDPFVQGTRLMHSIRVNMNNPDLPENADLLWSKYDKKVVTTPMEGRLEDFLDPWDFERIEDIKALNKNITDFDNIPEGTELVIQSGQQVMTVSDEMKRQDARNNFIAGKVSEDRFITDEVTNLYDLVKVGPDREKIISSILDLNDFNALGLDSTNTKDWTAIPRGITIRIPKAYDEPILSNMLFSTENRLKWAKEHPVRYTLFEEAIMKNIIDPINFLWVPGLKAIQFGSKAAFKGGYEVLAKGAEKSAYLGTTKKMADFTWSLSRVLFEKKAPLPEFYSNPEKLGLYQLISKGMKIRSLDLTTLSTLRTKLAAMSVVKALPAMFRPIVKMTDNEINSLREMNTIKYIESLNKLMDTQGLTKDQIETFLINYIKAGPNTTQAERNIFRVFSDNMGLSMQELEDIIDTSHPEFYYDKIYTSKETNIKDIVKPEIYNDPVKLKELIRVNDFEAKKINPEKIPAGVKVIVSEDTFVNKIKNQIYYSRFVTKPENEYMMLRMNKLDSIGKEAFFNFIRSIRKEVERIGLEKAKGNIGKIELLRNPIELNESISRMHIKYPQNKRSINQAVDLAKEFRRRTNFFADAVEKDILIPVKMTDNIKLFAMDKTGEFNNAFTVVKDPDTGIISLVYNKRYTGKFGLGMDLIAFNTKLYNKKITNLDTAIGTLTTEMKRMKVSGGKMTTTWFRKNVDGSTELMVQGASGQKPKVGYRWAAGSEGKEITLRSLLVTAAIRKDIGWLRTFFSDGEYARIYGSRIKGTDDFTEGLIDKIMTSTGKKIKIKESYARDFFDVINDIMNKKKFITDEQEIAVFNGDKQAEFLLTLTASVQDLYNTNRKLFNVTYGTLKKTYDLIKRDLANGLKPIHQMTPIEESTMMLMEKIDKHPNVFSSTHSKIIGRLLNDVNITPSELRKIAEELESLANSRRMQLKKVIILNKLRKEGLSEAMIQDVNSGIRTKFLFNTAKGETPTDVIRRTLATIPGFISPEDAQRFKIGKLSDEQIEKLGLVNKVEYLYATNKINRRFTYLVRKNIAPEMMPAVIDKFTRPLVDAAVDLMAKLDMDKAAPKRRMVTIITDAIHHSQEKKLWLKLPEGIVSHEVIDKLNRLEIDAAKEKLLLIQEKTRYKRMKSDKLKYFKEASAKKVEGLTTRYNQLRDAGVKYAEEHGEVFKDRLTNEFEISANPRTKKELAITPEIEKALYSVKTGEHKGSTLVISDRTPEGKSVIEFLRSRPKEFIEGSDFIIEDLSKIKPSMISKEITQLMVDKGMNPFLYWMLDKYNGLTMFNDDMVRQLMLSVNPNMSEELMAIYIDKLYKALISSGVLHFNIFKKEFPNTSEQRLMLMDKNELVKEINSSNLSKSRKQELINLARRKGSSILQKQLELSEIEKRTVTGKTEQGLDTLMSETKSAKRQTPVGENISAKDIPEQFDADKLKEISLSSGEGRESKINIAFNDKVMEEMKDWNAALFSIKKALGISDITEGSTTGTWNITKSFEGNLTTEEELAMLNITDGKYISVGGAKLTDETIRRTSPHERLAENFDKEKFVSKLGVAFDVPTKVGHEELEASIKKTAELGKLRTDKARVERHIDKTDDNINGLRTRITDNKNLVTKINKNSKIKPTEKEVRIEEYNNLNKQFNKSITEFERTKNELSVELDTVNRKIDSMTDASDFLVNEDKFNSESYKYIEERISEIENSLKEINRRINVEPNGFIHNNLSLSKAIAEKELARYKSILDIIVPWNLAKTNNISLTAKEIYQAAKGYISPDMDDKLNALMKLNDQFAKEANAGNLKKIGLDDVNLPTVKMTKVSADSLKTNFWDSLSNIRKPSEIRVPKVDTITVKSIENTQLLKDSITALLERTSAEKRYPLVIDLTGKLQSKLERHMPDAVGKMHIITNKDISSKALSNINLSTGTSLTQAEVKAYNEIIKNINEHGPVWLFGEEKELINPSKLKDAFFNKALDEDEKALLSQARKDFDKINSKFRESVSGDTMFFPEDPDPLVSAYTGLKNGEITKETIAQSDAVLAARTNKYMNDADISRYIVKNNLGESKVMAFQDATKNEKLLIIADERHGVLYKETKVTLDEARKNGMTFVFPKDMTRGEMLIYEYLDQFPGVKFSSIKNNELALFKRQIMSGKPKMLFTVSKEFADKNRELLFKAWSKANDIESGVIRIYSSSEKMLRDIQNNFRMQIKKWQNTTENFLPEFTRQKAMYGERPQDILIDLASVKKTNDIRKALDTNVESALRDYRESLMKTLPENADDITRKALIKQIENEVESTRILMDQIKREVFSFGKDKRFFEQLRSKISSRLLFYGMYDQPQVGLNPGYPDIVPEYVMALRSADWMLRNVQMLSDNVSSLGRVFMGTWIRAILLYRPRWQVWNALGDGVRAVGASRNVLIMLQYVEALTRAMGQFYWKALKETSKLPLELLHKAGRNKLARFMKHDLIDIDFTKPIIRTKYFELKSSLTNAERLVRDGGITAIGETVTPADAARMVSSGIDRIIASPEYAQKKIDLIRDTGLASRLSKRLKVIDSDIQIVSSALETSRRAVLAWNLLYKRSMNIAAAEMKVKKWMFDYRELTLAGRLIRNFFPFYTFTSKSLQLYLGICAKYGPGVWRAATAILDAFEEQHKNLPDQYKDRIEIGNNVWWLTSFGVQEYFEMIFNPTKMVQNFIKNPLRMLFGLSLGPIGSAAMTTLTKQGFYDTYASTQEFYDKGWTTEDIQNFRNKEENKFSDSITFDKAEESLYTFLAANLPFGQLAYDLQAVDLSTILRGNTTFNSKKVRTLMNYFFGANYKSMTDIEMVFDTIMKLPPGEQYILQQSLKKENPDLYDYLQQYSLLSKITKVLNATGSDWADKSKDLVTSVVVYNYYNLEAAKHGSGDEWLNENPQYAKVMQEVWSTGTQTSSKIYGKEKFDVAQIQSIANKILSKVKDVDDKKISKMKMAGISVPFTNAISKQDLRNAMYDGDGNFRLNSLDQLANIVDAYGLEGELFDINKVKTEAEKSYQDWKNLSLKAREEKLTADQKYYDSMSVVFKVLPNNLEELSQGESAKVWNKYNLLLNTLILSNPEYKARYLADMPEWQRKYNEFKAKYSEYWTELRSKFDDPDNNFFKQFNKKPTWFRNWYFYDNPEKKITFPKFSLIFNELEKNPKLNYYDLFFQKLGDKEWDTFRNTYFKSNPEALKKAQEYLKFQKMWNEFNTMDNLTWEGKRQKADYLKQHPDLTAYWARNDKSEEVIIKQKQEKYFDILYQIPADGRGQDYLLKYYILKAKADQFLKDNPDVQAYWNTKEKVYTGKEKVIRDLLVEYNKFTLQVDKTAFVLKHPELSEYFLNLVPPGIRRLTILEKLYFQLDTTEKRTAFVKARPELAEFWEVKKMPASFLINPSIRKEYQDKLNQFLKFTDAIQAKDSVNAELYRKSVDKEPDTDTEEGKWLASKMYQASMKAWASTFGSILSTYFFRTLPKWIRDQYFIAHPKSKILSYMPLGRALEEGLRIYGQQNKAETWADGLMFKYGKDMPYQLKEKVSREMIRLGKWTDRTAWSKERWASYQLDKVAKTNRIRRSEIKSNRLLSLEAQRVARQYTSSLFSKPLKEFGTINVFKGSPETEKNPANVFLGSEELVLRTIPVNKRVMRLFDYES